MGFNTSMRHKFPRNATMDLRQLENDFTQSINEARLKTEGISSFAISSFSKLSVSRGTSVNHQPIIPLKDVKPWGIEGKPAKRAPTEKTFSKSVGTIPRKNDDTFKTTLCLEFKTSGTCNYGKACRYAHGISELRPPPQASPFYKTILCRNFSTYGECHKGSKCRFIHHRNAGNSVNQKVPLPLKPPATEKIYSPWNFLPESPVESLKDFNHFIPSDLFADDVF